MVGGHNAYAHSDRDGNAHYHADLDADPERAGEAFSENRTELSLMGRSPTPLGGFGPKTANGVGLLPFSERSQDVFPACHVAPPDVVQGNPVLFQSASEGRAIARWKVLAPQKVLQSLDLVRQ
jgi:hypothetical protein